MPCQNEMLLQLMNRNDDAGMHRNIVRVFVIGEAVRAGVNCICIYIIF